MNVIRKIVKHKEKSAFKKLKNKSFSAIEELITQLEFIKITQEELPKYRNRLYTPIRTLCMFVSQAINSDSSCQKVVNEMTLTNKTFSVATGGYCRARQRLSQALVSKLTKAVARHNEQKIKTKWRWQNRTVYLIDGTTLTMPDTPDNQEVYPQTTSLPKGLGFPICRIVGIISLSTGSLINSAVSPYHGKGACEQTLLRSMLGAFKSGDVVLADAFLVSKNVLLSRIYASSFRGCRDACVLAINRGFAPIYA